MRRPVFVGLGVALAYALAGTLTAVFSLRFAIPSPIFPAAGIAAGAVMAWGPRMLPAVLAGRLLMSWMLAGTFGSSRFAIGFEASLAAVVTLQAAVGGLGARRLLRRRASKSTTFQSFALLAAAGPLSCWIAPIIGVPLLVAQGRLMAGDLDFVLFKWWMGDSIGAMWVTALFIACIGDRGPWPRQRDAVVGWLASALMLLCIGLAVVTQLDKQRLHSRFDTAVDQVAGDLRAAFLRQHHIAEALRRWPDAASSQDGGRALQAFVLEQLPQGSTLAWLPPGAGPAGEPAASASAAMLVLNVQGARAARLTIPLQSLVAPVMHGSILDLCLRSGDGEILVRTGQDAACRSSVPGLVRDEPIDIEGLRLHLRAVASPVFVARDRAVTTWTADALVLCGSILLIAFVFSARGRTARIERLVAERTRELEASEAHLRGVIGIAGVGIIHLRQDGSVDSVNPEAALLAGRDPASWAGLPLCSVFSPHSRPRIDAGIADAARSAAIQSVPNLKLPRPDGTTLDISMRLTSIGQAAGGSASVLCVLQDVSDARRASAAESARERAELENRTRSNFVSRMSHELRTPLNAILGFVQVLRGQSGQSASDREERLQHIEQAGWHLLSMIENVLLLGRLEAGGGTVKPVPVDLASAMKECVRLVEAEAVRHRVKTSVTVREGACTWAMADPTGVRQIVLNLLSNAIKYNRPGGALFASIVATSTECGIEIVDQGVGMTPEQIQGLFVPFNRLGREGSGTPGTGIGLAISKELATRMDGRIDVRSTPGEGSVFTLWLRACDAPEAEPHASAPKSSTKDSPRGRVLYIEDNEVNVLLMEAVFAEDAGLQFQSCATAAQALETVARGGIDLVLLDLGLPDMDGEVLLDKLLELDPTVRAPVIVVTADADVDTRRRVRRRGATDALAKPFDVPALRRAVSEALKEAAIRNGP